MIPNFILKRLYKSGSLRKTPEGIAFTLCNRIDTGQVNSIIAVVTDSNEISLSDIFLFPAGQEKVAGEAISKKNQLTLVLNKEVDVLLEGISLPEGKHNLIISLDIETIGRIDIKIKDSMTAIPARSLESSIEESLDQALEGSVPVKQADPIKVSILGAGSAVFAKTLMTDILATPGLEKGIFALVDIDEERLELAHKIAEKLIKRSGKEWTVESSADRLKMLPGSDFVISTIEVAGLRNVAHEYEIPLKYGVDQCIGDTIGPGGIFKMLRTGPSWMAIVKDIERLAPKAIVMNYTNPMSALTTLGLRSAANQQVGLCHSVQGTSQQLALYADVPFEEMRWQCAGINHMAWFTELSHKGEDLYPRLKEALEKTDLYEADPVRFEIMKHFGAFVTESSGHFSEYLPYFRKNEKALKQYTREGYLGESGYYASMWPDARAEADQRIREQLEGEHDIVIERSEEYASKIIEAVALNKPCVIHGNVINNGSIGNLPDNACVEVPIMIDRTGLHQTRFGELPEQMAALNRSHISVTNLMVKAVLEKDREAAVHALMLDPLSAAVCTPQEIRDMFDEMWESEKQDLEYFF
jgi:alpha-galactosidase